MTQFRRLALPLTLVFTGIFGLPITSSTAAEWTHRPEHSTLLVQPIVPDGHDVHKVLSELGPQLDLDGVDLTYRSSVPALFGESTVLRFTETYDGLEVLGTSVALLVSKRGVIDVANVNVARQLTVHSTPSVDVDKAKFVVEIAEPDLSVAAATVSLAVSPNLEPGGALVWLVDVPTGLGGKRFVVDAHTGELRAGFSRARNVLGRVYGINPVRTPVPEDVELLDLDESDDQQLNGWDGGFSVTNHAGGDLNGSIRVKQNLPANAEGDFLYMPPRNQWDTEDGFAQVSLYHHMTRMRRYFANEIGLDMSGRAWNLTAVANLTDSGQPYDNAFFSPAGLEGTDFDAPNLIAIGQGREVDFSIDSDVFLHEFTHYVTGNAIGFNTGSGFGEYSDYGITPEFSGAVDEGICDYFSGTVNGDPILAESLASYDDNEGISRDMSDSSFRCPDTIVGESHEDGRVVAALGWLVHEALGAELGDQVMWAGTALMPAGGSFTDYGDGIKAAADAMQAEELLTEDEAQIVADLVDQQGLDDCDKELAIIPDQPRKIMLQGLQDYAEMWGATCADMRANGWDQQSPFHFVATPEPEDTGIRFKVTFPPKGFADRAWSMYVRAGTHVSFVQEGRFALVVDQYDYSRVGIKTGSGEVVIDESSDPPFDVDTSYHIMVISKNCSTEQATITVRNLEVEPVEVEETEGNEEVGGGEDTGASEDLDAGTPQPSLDDPADGPKGQGTGSGCHVADTGGGEAHGGFAVLLALLGLAGFTALRR